MHLLYLALACSSDPALDSGGPATTPPDPTIGLSFSMDVDLIEDMEEPPQGDFHGSIFAEDQATAVGPIDGAVTLADFTVPDLDLADGGPTEILWESDRIEPQKLWVLGCFDTDDNDCDAKDPITVPNTNKFLTLADQRTDLTVYLGLLSP